VSDPAAPTPPALGPAARAYLLVVGLVALMWVVEIIDLLPVADLDRAGIEPRTANGLSGVIFAPFLHADFAHLISNTIPFLVLGFLVAASGVQRVVQVVVIVAVVAAIGTWLTGPSGTVHIGASGIVFGFLGYLVARGVFARHPGLLLVGAVVLFFYGGLLWGLLPVPGISWQGHLFGLVGGVLAAWVAHGRAAPAPATP
jgi:membrane associated rhomboid family serine protease